MASLPFLRKALLLPLFHALFRGRTTTDLEILRQKINLSPHSQTDRETPLGKISNASLR
jgi:hypothetical protein